MSERLGAGKRDLISREEARAEVDGWLRIKLKTGKCSELMRSEIAEGMRQRAISFAIFDELGQMEGSDPPRRSGTKPARPLKGELQGLMHKHYKTSSRRDFMLNIKNHWKRKGSKAERHRIESEFQRDGHAGKAAHEIVLGGYRARHCADQMTGEWIVYAVIADVNYYLTFATHKEAREQPEAVKERVRSCFAEFPELQAHLGW
jgi:hypothetical protein